MKILINNFFETKKIEDAYSLATRVIVLSTYEIYFLLIFLYKTFSITNTLLELEEFIFDSNQLTKKVKFLEYNSFYL